MKTLKVASLIFASLMPLATSSPAGEFWEGTQIVGVEVGPLSSTASDASFQRSFLANGSTFSLGRYYNSDWKDLRVTFLSPITDNFGLYWGFGTGEKGAKYSIDPSLKLGFLFRTQIDPNSTLAIAFTVVLGGRLSEKPCTADYGAIGGVQVVNCRLSDSFLAPTDTLDHLFDEPSPDQMKLSVGYRITF